MGRRVGKKRNGVLERGWLWRGQLQPHAEFDGTGAVTKRFVYGEGVNVPDLMVTATATYRLVRDHLGSVRLVVDDATGAVAQEMVYDAWGRVLVDTNPGFQPFGFAGGLYDPETGLVRFGARDYDAEVGRWTAKDPWRFWGGDGNLYAYVGRDPANVRDESGALPQLICDKFERGYQCVTRCAARGIICPPYRKNPKSSEVGALGSCSKALLALNLCTYVFPKSGDVCTFGPGLPPICVSGKPEDPPPKPNTCQ
jgi:RHS repeat-associated protein